MRTFTAFIKKRPISFQVSQHAAVRFAHLYETDITDEIQIQIKQ